MCISSAWSYMEDTCSLILKIGGKANGKKLFETMEDFQSLNFGMGLVFWLEMKYVLTSSPGSLTFLRLSIIPVLKIKIILWDLVKASLLVLATSICNMVSLSHSHWLVLLHIKSYTVFSLWCCSPFLWNAFEQKFFSR